jgi:hypothetical protein
MKTCTEDNYRHVPASEIWATDASYFRVVGWGYYFATALDAETAHDEIRRCQGYLTCPQEVADVSSKNLRISISAKVARTGR